MRLLSGYAKPVIALAVTPDGSRLFSAAQGQSMIWEWDVASAQVVRKIEHTFATRNSVRSLPVSPAGDLLVFAAVGRGVVYRPVKGGEPRELGPEAVASRPGRAGSGRGRCRAPVPRRPPPAHEGPMTGPAIPGIVTRGPLPHDKHGGPARRRAAGTGEG